MSSHTTDRHPAWHTLAVAEVAHRLKTIMAHGLTEAEAAKRLAQHGQNELQEARKRSPWRMLLDQFADFMIIVLIIAALISGMVGDIKDTVAIVIIVVLNAVIGFVQEYRAEQAMAALKKMAAISAVVLREGQPLSINATELVPGDVVMLEAGNIVPADLRILEAAPLRVDEATLTGESVAVDKRAQEIAESDIPLGDRHNMAYKGTTVAFGRGRGLVVATGMDTELGHIAQLLEQDGELKTPLQKRLVRFGKRLALAAMVICLIVLVVGVIRGESVMLMLLTAISLAVAAIPEALPAVVTISLALGARKMVKHHALIRRLPAVETLGSVTFICSDKTGTLTQNHMKVEEAFADNALQRGGMRNDSPVWDMLLQAMALSNDAVRNRHGKISGDPTEVALYQAAAEAGQAKETLETSMPRVKELPFDSERKRMTTIHRTAQGYLAFTKGAPESVLPRCTSQLTANGEVPFSPKIITLESERIAADGLRVLAIAYRHWDTLPESDDEAHVEQGLTLLGLVGLADPPRHEAKEAVSLCKSAGITPVMITGDHAATARTIGQRLGIIDGDDEVMTGAELAKLDQKSFAAQVGGIRVYARMDPQQKIRIVQALQDQGEFVAMTGDGVNDAPALKRADIGIAMGKDGTDVAREASALVLLDDNFATIVHAVREGRRIFDNIRKFIKYAITCNAGEVWTIFLAPFMGLPVPLLPIHILWVNLVTDGLPGLALTAEPAERGIMRRPPRPPQESIFSRGMWQHMVWVGLLMGAICIVVQAWALHTGSTHWQTMVFTVLTLSQMGHVLAIHTERKSLFSTGLLSNPMLTLAVLLTFALQMATIYLPALNPVFKTQPLSGQELMLCIALSSVVFFAVEVEKWLVRRGLLYQAA